MRKRCTKCGSEFIGKYKDIYECYTCGNKITSFKKEKKSRNCLKCGVTFQHRKNRLCENCTATNLLVHDFDLMWV